MIITEYANLNNEPMILVIESENNKAESMTKATYEAQQVALSTPMISSDE